MQGSRATRECLAMNTIETDDRLTNGTEFAYYPQVYDYTNYARIRYRVKLLLLADTPSQSLSGPCGSD
jgi:hypothetical protein